MRRILLVIGLACMLLLAGCADGGLDDDPTDGIEEPPNDGDVDTDSPDTDESEPIVDPDGSLEIHHLDVGQADSTLFITPDGETILIDTGDWRQDGSGVIEYLDERDIDRIDHLIGTHGHADHIGGHAAIIEEFETNRDGIGAVYDSGVPHTSQTYENYLDAVDEHDVELFVVEEGDALPIDNEALSGLVVNPPESDSGDDLHANSIAIVFQYGDVRYLTTGDSETDAESRMLDEWVNELDVDIYQAGHHGSSTSSSAPFMDVVSPEIAIISSNYDSQYGHPHDEVLEDFETRDIETYWSGVHGDIVLTTDGSEIAVETAEEFSSDAGDLLAEKPRDEASTSMQSPIPRMVG